MRPKAAGFSCQFVISVLVELGEGDSVKWEKGKRGLWECGQNVSKKQRAVGTFQHPQMGRDSPEERGEGEGKKEGESERERSLQALGESVGVTEGVSAEQGEP